MHIITRLKLDDEVLYMVRHDERDIEEIVDGDKLREVFTKFKISGQKYKNIIIELGQFKAVYVDEEKDNEVFVEDEEVKIQNVKINLEELEEKTSGDTLKNLEDTIDAMFENSKTKEDY